MNFFDDLTDHMLNSVIKNAKEMGGEGNLKVGWK